MTPAGDDLKLFKEEAPAEAEEEEEREEAKEEEDERKMEETTKMTLQQGGLFQVETCSSSSHVRKRVVFETRY